MSKHETKGYICDLDCGNSPKAQFVREFNSWFVSEDTEKILSVLTPDIEWEMVGEAPIRGLEQVRASFFAPDHAAEKRPTLETMAVEGIITHGRQAVSYGTMTMSDGTKYKFSDLIEFKDLSKNPRIRKVISFVISIPK